MCRSSAATVMRALLGTAVIILGGCPGPPVVPDPENRAPVADAGMEQNVTGGRTVTLDATGSSDPDGDPLSFEWTQIAGPSVSLAAPFNAVTTLVAVNADTTLRFSLIVTDPSGASSVDAVNITVTEVDNLPPTANAGFDQFVDGGVLVTLNGAGSSDPDGDALSYEWTQVDGPAVQISGANSVTATLVSPNDSLPLTFQLTVDDGNANTHADDVVITVSQVPSTLFVANVGGDSILSFADVNAVDGDIDPTTNLSGPATLLNFPADVVLVSTTRMIVASADANALYSYSPALDVTDDIPPVRILVGGLTQMDRPLSMAYHRDTDLLFVSNGGANNDILVFEGANSFAFLGNVPPVRVISSTDLQAPTDIAFDSDTSLYVANTGNVVVFDDAVQLDGEVLPDRTISSASLTAPIGVFLDKEDTLFIVEGTGSVLVFEQASALDGNVTPTRIFTVQGALGLTSITVGNDGTGYIIDINANAIYVYDDVSQLTGSQAPDRVIRGAETMLDAPVRMFLEER